MYQSYGYLRTFAALQIQREPFPPSVAIIFSVSRTALMLFARACITKMTANHCADGLRMVNAVLPLRLDPGAEMVEVCDIRRLNRRRD